LYNLKDDIGEKRNLAAQYPERVDRLKQLLEASEATFSKEVKKPRGKKKGKSGAAKKPAVSKT